MAGLHRSSSALLSMASPAHWWLVLLLRCSLMSCNWLFQMQQQAAFDAVPLDPRSCPGLGGEAVHVSPLVFSSCTSGLPSLLGSPHEHCKVADYLKISHGVSFAGRSSRAAICACLAIAVCVGSVILELWVMRGTCSWSALLLQISETSFLHWLQSAQVSWLGLCGPKPGPWSAGTTLLASIECHADDRRTLFHPFSFGSWLPGMSELSSFLPC